jgi:hypothetical protein
MKRFKIIIFLGTAFICLSSLRFAEETESCGSEAGRKSAGPPSCYAGEPPNNNTCAKSGCHDDNLLNSGSAKLFLSLGDTLSYYIPGKTYTVTFGITRPGLLRGGFQIIALQDNKQSQTPGIVTITEQSRTQRLDANNPHSGGGCATQQKVWIEHDYNGIDDVANDTLKWKYTWQAPDSVVGGITFYLAALEANKDLETTGDTVYAIQRTFAAPANVLSISNISEQQVKIYPNPFSESFHIESNVVSEFSIRDLHGRIIQKGVLRKGDNIVSITECTSGIYFIEALGKMQMMLKL